GVTFLKGYAPKVTDRGMDRGYVAHASSAAEVSLMRIGSWIIEESFVCFWHGAEALPPGVGLRAPRPQGSVVRGQREGHRLQQTYWSRLEMDVGELGPTGPQHRAAWADSGTLPLWSPWGPHPLVPLGPPPSGPPGAPTLWSPWGPHPLVPLGPPPSGPQTSFSQQIHQAPPAERGRGVGRNTERPGVDLPPRQQDLSLTVTDLTAGRMRDKQIKET
ncbi:unnamed protein product, partial [Gadus morhua 'NCC']